MARLVVILGALTAIGPLSIDMYLPAFPAIGSSLDAGASQVQLTLTACLAGLALGQLLAGPISDRLGRRRPLLAGVSCYVAVSVLCALAPSIEALVALRFLQGLSGAAGIVIAQAVVRDLYAGTAAVRVFSSLMLVIGLAPILAPIVGGQMLRATSWHGIFVALAAIAGGVLAMAALGLRETLPPARRDRRGLRQTLRTLRGLLGERTFMAFALGSALVFGGMFAYVSSSPFVLQDIYGASPQLYSVMFGANGIGLVAASQVNGRLATRFGPVRLLLFGMSVIASGSAVLLVIFATQAVGLWAVLVSLFVIVSGMGFVLPNATALALADHPEVAGSASALLGVLQFLIGAVTAPLTGIAGGDTAVPLGVLMTTMSAAALLVLRVLGGRQVRPWR